MTLDSYIQILLPEALSNAVKQAASEHYLTSSGYIRQVLAERLRLDGVDLLKPGAQPASAERDK